MAYNNKSPQNIFMKKKRIYKVDLEDRPFFKKNYPGINPYLLPQTLTECKYELVTKNNRYCVVTSSVNREDMLRKLDSHAKVFFVQMKDYGQYHPCYKIFFTENGVKELLIDLKHLPHKLFIASLCQPVSSI